MCELCVTKFLCSTTKCITNYFLTGYKIPGGTHIFGRTGMCRSNGSLFYKKSLNMGPVFNQKILKHGSTFLTEPKFSGFRRAKTPKIAKFLKNGPIFQEKSLKMGTLSAKITLKMGRGFEARAAHPCPTQI